MLGRFHSHARSDRRRRSAGFSFVEILFAVAVLGVGFIMLAAIFPVGLQQTKLTLDETTAAANARGAVATLTQLAQRQFQYTNTNTATPPDFKYQETSLLPDTYFGMTPTTLAVGQTVTLPGQLRSLRDVRNFADQPMSAGEATNRRNTIWNRVCGELLTKSNERNAFVVMYRRDVRFTGLAVGGPERKAAESAQIVLINAQVAAQSAYTTKDSIKDPAQATPPVIYNLEPRPVGVSITYDGGVGGYIARFSSVSGNYGFPTNAAYDAAAFNAPAEGAFVVISDDNVTDPTGRTGRMNGRIYRLGNYRTDIGAPGYELAPGYGFIADPGADGTLYSGATTGPGSAKDDITELGLNNGAKLRDAPVVPSGAGSLLTSGGPAVAYILGKGFTDSTLTPNNANTSAYAGPAQDVAAYTTFIPVQ